MTWTAWALLALTGVENLRRIGLNSPWLAAKLVVVIALLALAAHRDFAVVPRAIQAVEGGGTRPRPCRACGRSTGSCCC